MNRLQTKKNECVHFGICSGCTESTDFLPPPVWKEMEEYFLQHEIVPSFFSKALEGWRLRVKLAVREEEEKLLIGLFEKGTHHVVEIPNCLAHHPKINEALLVLKRALLEEKISGYREKENQGDLRYLQLTLDRKSQKIQLVFVVNEKSLSPRWQTFAHQLFSSSALWQSIWVNLQPKSTNTIFGENWHLLEGEEFLFEEIAKEKVAFHPAAFFQAHLTLFEEMILSIQKNIPSCDTLVEFYAGVGVIGKCLQEKAKTIFFVEENPFAKSSFIASLNAGEENHLHYFSCDVDEKTSLCKEAQLIIVDPPRKGLSALLLEEICRKEEGQLIYLSCHFPSFQRDTEKLLSNGWKMEKAEGYLLFPGTDHVETLVFFRK